MDILVKFSDDALWGNFDPIEYNAEESAHEFRRLLKNELKRLYPTADVRVSYSDVDTVEVDYMTGTLMCEEVHTIVNDVFQDWDWMVLRDETDCSD